MLVTAMAEAARESYICEGFLVRKRGRKQPFAHGFTEECIKELCSVRERGVVQA